MSGQLALAFDPEPIAEPEPSRWYDAEAWDYYRGLPDLSAAGSEYTVLIRAPWDPTRETRESRRARMGLDAITEWKTWRKTTAEEWCSRIVAHAADGVPRTFNHMSVELVGATADVVGDTARAGLWLAVERGHLWWTRQAPIHFVHQEFVKRCACETCAKEAA